MLTTNRHDRSRCADSILHPNHQAQPEDGTPQGFRHKAKPAKQLSAPPQITMTEAAAQIPSSTQNSKPNPEDGTPKGFRH